MKKDGLKLKTKGAFDPIDLEILWSRLITLVDEAAYAIVRTSMSKVVVEGRDFGVLLYDASARLLAADVSIASKVGTTSIAVKEFLKIYSPSSLKEGDVLVSNNPWWIMGHLNDIAVVAPLFHKNRLIGFAECMAHMADIGGSLSGAPREVYEEGLIIPPIKAVEKGIENQTFFSILEANVRVPRQVSSDVRALITGLKVMQTKVVEFLNVHNIRNLENLSNAVRRHSEAAMRRGISEQIPNGVYEGFSTVDGFDEPMNICAKITSRNGNVTIDLDGSSPQSSFGINCTMVYTYVWSMYTIKCIACPSVPNNEGTFAPIRVLAPEGSFLNPSFPAPVKMKPSSGHYIPIAILDALKNVVDKRILAESGNKTLLYISGRNPEGRAFSDLMFIMGGMGARTEKDGLHSMSFPANSSNIPIEVLENIAPIRVKRKHLRQDSGGYGHFRGGCGQVFEFENISQLPITVRAEHGKLKTAPLGLKSGGAGATGHHKVNGKPIADKLPVILKVGDVMTLEIPGSGGFGSAKKRDPKAVKIDLADGIISPKVAFEVYGLKIESMGKN